MKPHFRLLLGFLKNEFCSKSSLSCKKINRAIILSILGISLFGASPLVPQVSAYGIEWGDDRLFSVQCRGGLVYIAVFDWVVFRLNLPVSPVGGWFPSNPDGSKYECTG